MRIEIIIGVVAVSFASPVSAEKYKRVTDAAYCLGVYQSEVNDTLKIHLGEKDAKPHAAEIKQLRADAFVDSAIKQRKIRAITAIKMRSVGYTDGNTCLQQQERCTEQWYLRAENKVDPESNKQKLVNCNSLAAVVCERAYEICE